MNPVGIPVAGGGTRIYQQRLQLAVRHLLLFILGTTAGIAAPTHNITVDGNFSDWANVPAYYDPVSGPGVLHNAPSVQNGHVVLTWAGGATGMLLKRTTSLTNPDWQTVSGSDTTNQVTLPIGPGNAFFRLEEP